MKTEIEDLCLQYIADEWRKLRPLERRDPSSLQPPWGVWIRLFGPISTRTIMVRDQEHTILKVWFLTERGLEERDPWAYARFITVLGYRPWALGRAVVSEAVWGYYHELALAAFAEYIEIDRIYLETQWGIRWGQGCRIRIDEQRSLQIEETLWLS